MNTAAQPPANTPSPPEDGRSLKLRARDGQDLESIAAVTQDALVPMADMAFLPDEKRFVLAMNRFRWERPPEGEGVYERVNCGLCFENVARVETRGLDLKQRDFILDLLTVVLEEGFVVLSFAGYRDVRLTVTNFDCKLDDFGEPWPTRSRPAHGGGENWADWQDAPSPANPGAA